MLSGKLVTITDFSLEDSSPCPWFPPTGVVAARATALRKRFFRKQKCIGEYGPAFLIALLSREAIIPPSSSSTD
jgi:hypothetical protein